MAQRPNATVRRAEMVEEVRRAEEVRQALLELRRITGSYPPGDEMRERLETMGVERVLDVVERDISTRRSDLIHPHGT